MQRRLPIYFLIDVSESMAGEPISQVEEGMETIVRELKSDPFALETVFLSILVFAGKAKTLSPLTDLISFYPSKFPIGSGTSLTNGLKHLKEVLNQNKINADKFTKPDWKPIVFLFTDGVPTDDSKDAILDWKANWSDKTILVAVSFGDEENAHFLNQLTDNVLLFKNSTPAHYRHFFKWVTSSILTSTRSLETNSKGFELASMEDEILVNITKSPNKSSLATIDRNFAVFLARCQQNKSHYLIKYKKQLIPTDLIAGLEIETINFKLNGTYKIDQTYFDLSDETYNSSMNISTEELEGYPNCPCCGNQSGFSVCTCMKIHCSGSESITTCPWCGKKAKYGYGNKHIDVNRQQG